MRCMRVPQLLHHVLVIVCSLRGDPMVADCPQLLSSSSPRTRRRCVAMTVKLVANMLVLTFRQSVQWHMKQVEMPSPRMGWQQASMQSASRATMAARCGDTHESILHPSTKAGCCCFAVTFLLSVAIVGDEEREAVFLDSASSGDGFGVAYSASHGVYYRWSGSVDGVDQ